MALTEALMIAGPGAIPDLMPPAPPWMRDAACREHPEIDFVPPEGKGGAIGTREALAVEVCRRCLVRRECLAYALDDPNLVGVWGGTTSAQRRILLRACG